MTEEPAGLGLRWTMPPLLLGGALSFDIRQDRAEDAPRRQQVLLGATVNAASFIYAPWLATVNARLSLTGGYTDAALAGAGSPEPVARQDRYITGELRSSLFPRSRFPAEFRYEVNDTRVDHTLPGGVDYRQRNLLVTQRYRPVDGSFSVSGSYERRTQDSGAIGQDSQESLLADFSTAWKRQWLGGMLTFNRNRRGNTGEETEFFVTQIRHSYSGSDSWVIDSSGDFARSSEHLRSFDRELTLAQVSSVGLWSSPVMPLQVTGSVRASTAQGIAQRSTDGYTVGLGASYEFTPRARLSAAMTATRLGQRTLLSTEGVLNGSYQGETIQLGAVNWDWFAGAALSAARNQVVQDATLSAQLGQTFSRSWQSGPNSSVGASLSQTLGAAQSAGGHVSREIAANNAHNDSRALGLTGALNWVAQGPQGNAFARLSVSDSRQFSGDQASYQLANLQVSGSYELDRRRSWSGDLTLQRLLQSSTPQFFTGQAVLDPSLRVLTNGATGELTWRNNRVFDLPRLRFTSRLRLSRDYLTQMQSLVSVADRELASLEERLDYQVGRLDTSLSWLWTQADGKRRQTLLWRLQRNFGD